MASPFDELLMPFHPQLLDGILVCTKCRSPLVQDGDTLISVNPDCRLKFDIRDGIPNMLIDEAQALDREQWSDVMRRHGRDPATGAS
jgi:uncharacterized protein